MRLSAFPFIAVAACGGSSSVGVLESEDDPPAADHPCFQEMMKLELGTGEFGFKPLVPGGTIEVIHGTQDGHHILGSLRIQNITDVATIRYTITTSATGQQISDQIYRIRLTEYEDGGDCAWQAIGLYGYLGRIDPGTAPFLMEQNVMEMTVTNAVGESASVSVDVFPYVKPVESSDDSGVPTPQ